MKLKNLNKRIRRLVENIAKETKKLAKLRLKQTAESKPRAPKKSNVKNKTSRPGKKAKIEAKSKEKTAAPVPARKKKRRLSSEGRAKLAALMNARWAARKAAGEQASAQAEGGSPPAGQS